MWRPDKHRSCGMTERTAVRRVLHVFAALVFLLHQLAVPALHCASGALATELPSPINAIGADHHHADGVVHAHEDSSNSGALEYRICDFCCAAAPALPPPSSDLTGRFSASWLVDRHPAVQRLGPELHFRIGHPPRAPPRLV
jgi:hypothetical protein